jgi:hypothetical protein
MGAPAWQFEFADSSAKALFAHKWKDKLAAGNHELALDERG